MFHRSAQVELPTRHVCRRDDRRQAQRVQQLRALGLVHRDDRQVVVALRAIELRPGNPESRRGGFHRCRPSKNSEHECAGNGRFALEGARSVVVYISRL